VTEAFVDVRAAGFLAHGDQAVLAQLGLQVGHRIARGDAHADPRRLAQHRGVGELHRRAADLVTADLLDTGLQRRGRGIGLHDLQGNGARGGFSHGVTGGVRAA
jgi:hypothetical protein